MTTRNCARCAQEKTISGVWYLISSPMSGAFVCEACFRAAPAAQERPTAPQMPAPSLGLLSGWSSGSLPAPASAGTRLPRG